MLSSDLPEDRRLPGPLSGLRSLGIRAALSVAAPTDRAVEVDGFHLLFDDEVPAPAGCNGFCPTTFLARNLDVGQGERLLDLATGCGLVALHAARRGARVTAVDWHPGALSSLRRNALMAGFEAPDLRQGEGLEATPGERFDVIAWAAPFLAGTPRQPLERRLLRGTDPSFAHSLACARDALDRGGRLLLPFPDRDGASWLTGQLEGAGFRFAAVVMQRFARVGRVRLYQAWPPGPGVPAGEVEAGEALPGAGWVLRDR